MRLEVEYERLYQRNEPESLQNIIIKYVRYNIKSMYPGKKFHSILEEHLKKFLPYSGECEYQLDFRSEDKDKPWGVATIYRPIFIRNHKKTKEIQKDGYKFYKIDK